MKKIFTFLLAACLCSIAWGQRPEAVIEKVGDVMPVIDGQIDDLWETVEQHNVDKPYTGETPTVGSEGETYWKMLWSDQGLYILIVVNDDVWYPYTGTGDAYTFDKIELYFDTNYVLEDGIGGQNGSTGNRQIAPDPTLTKLNGELLTQTILGGDVQYAFKVDNPAWTTEWFIPWESIPDKDGNLFDKSGTMGFDVDVTDNDGSGRQRMMWANVGTVNENWSNMDDAGHITFAGAGDAVNIDALTVSGAQDITVDNGTCQLTVAVDPVDATQPYKWIISGGTGMGTVDKHGVVTAIKDGTILVKAVSSDGFIESNEVTINVSGQKVTHFEVSYIKNGDFTDFDAESLAPGSPWSGGSTVVDGVLQITNTNTIGDAPNPWDWTVGQNVNIPAEMKDLPYILQFKAWAESERIFDVDLELIGDDYTRFGDSSDPNADSGHSQWRFTLTTEPTVYTLHITNFSRMDERPQKFNLFAGMANPTVYVDSVFLVTEADYILSSKELSKVSSMKLYPNPVGSAKILNVSLAAAKGSVAIYNAVGQKIVEKSATTTTVQFDVANLRKGMYFVRLSDGTTQKFVR